MNKSLPYFVKDARHKKLASKFMVSEKCHLKLKRIKHKRGFYVKEM